MAAKPAPAVAPVVEPQALDLPRVLSLIDLDAGQCKWPVGDPLEGWCGCPAPEGKSYCEGHHARAFVAPRSAIPGARLNYQLKVRVQGGWK